MSMDAKNVYAFNKKIKGIDRASAVLLKGYGCLMDRHRIFFADKEITKEDYLKRLEYSEGGCRFERENIENGKLFNRILDEWPSHE